MPAPWSRAPTPGAGIPVLRSHADLDRLLVADPGARVLIFKHSTTCPISAAARREVEAALAGGDLAGVRPALVRVIEDRPLSQAIAKRWAVTHQSPQALLVRGAQVLWHASHRRITREALRSAAAQTAAPHTGG